MADLIYLVEVNAYDQTIPGVTTLRYCSGVGFATLPSETPPNTLYEPRVVQPCNFTRTAFADARVLGGSTQGYGEIILNNADQALCPLRDLGMDGRICVVRVGQHGAAYPGGFTTFINGTVEQVEVSASKVTLRLRDNLMLLDIPVQQTLYLGNNVLPNGAEGTVDDIIGQPKPLCYGHCFHVLPVCVNTALLIYQVHDGAVQSIDAVFDGGNGGPSGSPAAGLSFAADYPDLATLSTTPNQPPPGRYSTCKALGLFRLGLIPGKVTAHVHGDNAAGYVNTVAGITKRILTQRGGISAASCDASFAALDIAFPAECGVYVGQAGGGSAATPQSTLKHPVIASQIGPGNTVHSAIDAILLSGGCWLAPTRINTWTIGQLIAPSGTPAAVFTDVDLIDIDSQATADPTAGMPVFNVFLRYKHYAGVLGTSEVAGSLGPGIRADVTQEFRTANAVDFSVQTVHPLAARLYRDTCLTVAADANAEAARTLALHKVRRDFVKAAVRLDETKAALELGSIVQIVTHRLGYDAGRLFVVVGISSDGRKHELTLDLWG